MLPCVIFEDQHLLAVNKPAGWNTHAPGPYAGEGIYDWVRHREPRWADLAIIHRLDKETSGLMVFSKTSLANRSLTEQFTRRTVRKKYLLVTDRKVVEGEVKSSLARAGARYVSWPAHGRGEPAETRFRRATGETVKVVQSAIEPAGLGSCYVVQAEPLTGRTHQIRVHAAEKGFPILGDTLYGGTPAPRLYLHAAELWLKHPASGKEIALCAAADFGADTGFALRGALIEPELTNAYRMIHGASDCWPGWYVERLGDNLLSCGEQPLDAAQRGELERLMKTLSARAVSHKVLARPRGKAGLAQASPQTVAGETRPTQFTIRENGMQFELSFDEGYSVGLFLDQRDNRRRLFTRHVAAGFPLSGSASESGKFDVLNTFAYTCGFSVCAAKAGARTTSMDLSRKYLDWGKRNFALNEIDPAQHDFIYGDTFAWLRRLARKQRLFDVILLDPPTFSRSKESGVFQVEKDYGKLVKAALPLLKAGGVLFASANAAGWPPEKFLATVEAAVRETNRKIVQRHYAPQPPDFPISRSEPAYLKTVWLRVG